MSSEEQPTETSGPQSEMESPSAMMQMIIEDRQKREAEIARERHMQKEVIAEERCLQKEAMAEERHMCYENSP